MERDPRELLERLRAEAERMIRQAPAFSGSPEAAAKAHPTAGTPALTAERIERALEARSRFEGGNAEFLGASRTAVYAATIPGFPARPGLAEIFGSDADQIGRDFERLMWLHSAELYGPDHGPAGTTPEEEALYAEYAERFRAISGAPAEPVSFQQGPVEIGPDDPEAREWLSVPGRQLHNERFDSAAEALEFVEELYAAGAERVVVSAASLRNGGAGADTLLAALPADPAGRSAVLAIVNREAREEGFDEEEDTGQSAVLLWWD